MGRVGNDNKKDKRRKGTEWDRPINRLACLCSGLAGLLWLACASLHLGRADLGNGSANFWLADPSADGWISISSWLLLLTQCQPCQPQHTPHSRTAIPQHIDRRPATGCCCRRCRWRPSWPIPASPSATACWGLCSSSRLRLLLLLLLPPSPCCPKSACMVAAASVSVLV